MAVKTLYELTENFKDEFFCKNLTLGLLSVSVKATFSFYSFQEKYLVLQYFRKLIFQNHGGIMLFSQRF